MTAINQVVSPAVVRVLTEPVTVFPMQIPEGFVEAVRAGIVGEFFPSQDVESGGTSLLVFKASYDLVRKLLGEVAANLAEVTGKLQEARAGVLASGEKLQTLIKRAQAANEIYDFIFKRIRGASDQALLFSIANLVGLAAIGVGCLGLYLQSRHQAQQAQQRTSKQQEEALTWLRKVCVLTIGGGLIISAVATCGVVTNVISITGLVAQRESIADIRKFEDMLMNQGV